jgi:hypothetical protein
MRQFETAFQGHRVAGGSGAYVVSRRDSILLALVACVPVPLLAVSGLAVPLPEIVQRVAASLVPFVTRDDPAQSEALSRASIRLAPGESAQSASRISRSVPVAVRRQPLPGPAVSRVVRPAAGAAAPAAGTGRPAPARAERANSAATATVTQDPAPAPASRLASGAGGDAASGSAGSSAGSGGTGGGGSPAAKDPVVPRIVVGPVELEPSVESQPGSTTISATATLPVAGDATVTATLPVDTSALPALPVEDPTAVVTGVVETVQAGLGGLGGLGGR